MNGDGTKAANPIRRDNPIVRSAFPAVRRDNPRLLELAHALVWGNIAYLIHVGLDDAGLARTVRVTMIHPNRSSCDLVDDCVTLTVLLRDWPLVELAARNPANAGAMAFLIRQARAVEIQAGPIVRYAHGLVKP